MTGVRDDQSGDVAGHQPHDLFDGRAAAALSADRRHRDGQRSVLLPAQHLRRGLVRAVELARSASPASPGWAWPPSTATSPHSRGAAGDRRGALPGVPRRARRAGLADDDPWRALSAFLFHTIDAQITDPSLSPVSAAPANALPRTTELKAALRTIGGRLLDRAREAGAVRADLTPGDLIPLMCGITYAATAHDSDRAARTRTARRYLTLLLTGLRT